MSGVNRRQSFLDIFHAVSKIITWADARIMVVDADPTLVLAPFEDTGQRGKVDFAFSQVVITKKKRRVLRARFVYHPVGKLDILPGKRVFTVDEIHENQAVVIFFEELDNVRSAQVEMNRIRGPVEALGVRELQH